MKNGLVIYKFENIQVRKPEALFRFGPAENVSLSESELAKLKERFGVDCAQEWIDTFSEQKAAKGYTYKSDYFAILAWARREQKADEHVEAKADDKEPSPEIQAAIIAEQKRQLVIWEHEKAEHRHTGRCKMTGCKFDEKKRPKVKRLML